MSVCLEIESLSYAGPCCVDPGWSELLYIRGIVIALIFFFFSIPFYIGALLIE